MQNSAKILILAVGIFPAVVLLVPAVANAAQAAGANSGREIVAFGSAKAAAVPRAKGDTPAPGPATPFERVPPVPFERGLSPEALIKQRADQAAAQVPGLRDAVAAAEALGEGRFRRSALLFTRAIEQAEQSSVGNSGYFEGRGIAYALWNRYRLADDDFVQAAQLSPGRPTPKTWLAVVRWAEGGPETLNVAALSAGDPLAGQWSRWATEMRHGRRQDLQQAAALALTVARDLGSRLTEGVGSDAILLEQAANLSRQNKHAESLAILQRIGPRFGNDPLWLYVKGGDDLALGRWADARAEYSRTLAARPDLAVAYLGRALAAAHLGQTRQVAVDRQMAGQLDPKVSRQFEDQHGRELAALLAAVPRQSADDLAGRLIDDARQKAPWPKLVQDGRLVVLAVEAKRKWADEQSNDGLLRFEELAAGDPGDARRWADLATYVYRQTGVPTVWNGPDNPSRPLRIEGPQQFSDQCARAEQFADQALALDPRNIRAIATKAWLLHAREDNAAAESLADRGLRLAPFYPPLEQLKGLLRPQGSAAEWLRAPRVLSGRGWWTVENPAPAELAQARAYQQASEQSMIPASRQAKAAYAKYAAALQASVLQGDYYDWLGDAATAAAHYDAALELDGDNAHALRALRDIYAEKLHDSAKALRYEVRLASTIQTTAAPLLRAAGDLVGQARWTSAGKVLDEALRLDAADPRIYAYDATLCSWRAKPGEAVPFWLSALAVEEARTNLNGESLLAGTQPLQPDEKRIGVIACWGLFRNQMALGQEAPAMDDLICMEAIRSRATSNPGEPGLFLEMPAPDHPASPLPAAENARLMASDADLLLARRALAQGRIELAATYLAGVRRNGYAGNDPEVRSEVDDASYAVYRRLGDKYAPEQLARIFGASELNEFAMRDRGAYPRLNLAGRPAPTAR